MKSYTDIDFDNIARPRGIPTPTSSDHGPNKAYVDPPVDSTTTLVGSDVKDVWKRLYWPTVVQVSAYSAGNLSSVTFFKDDSSVANSNRLAKSTLTYSTGKVTSEVLEIFSLADGVTVLKTITRTYTYSGNDVIKSVLGVT